MIRSIYWQLERYTGIGSWIGWAWPFWKGKPLWLWIFRLSLAVLQRQTLAQLWLLYLIILGCDVDEWWRWMLAVCYTKTYRSTSRFFSWHLGAYIRWHMCAHYFFWSKDFDARTANYKQQRLLRNSDIAILAKITTQVRYQFLTDLLWRRTYWTVSQVSWQSV